MTDIEAIEALRQLIERYGRAVDERDLDALTGLFTDDAVVVGVRGEQTIAEWLDAMRAPRAFPVSMHMMGNPLIEVAADGQTAALDTYAVVYQIGGDGQGDLTLGTRYRDDAVHDGTRWRIRRRTSTTVWMR